MLQKQWVQQAKGRRDQSIQMPRVAATGVKGSPQAKQDVECRLTRWSVR